MKKIRKKLGLFCIGILFTFSIINAQTLTKSTAISELPIIYLSEGVNVHIIAPEPIQFVDLSTNDIMGDLPSDNIARVKINEENRTDSISIDKKLHQGDDLGIISVVGQSFVAQYRAIYQSQRSKNLTSNLHITAEEMQPLEHPNIKFSAIELRDYSNKLFAKKVKRPIRSKNDLKLKVQLNNVYVMSDYIFLDITFKNKSNLSYDIEDIKFSIDDKKIYKATNNQSIILKPIYSLYHHNSFRKSYRNIYVFKKFTYPNSKVLNIRLIEKQLSGRTIELKVKYSDILRADTF